MPCQARRRSGRLRTSLGVLAALALAAAACGDTSTSTAPAPTSGAAPASAPATTAPATPTTETTAAPVTTTAPSPETTAAPVTTGAPSPDTAAAPVTTAAGLSSWGLVAQFEFFMTAASPPHPCELLGMPEAPPDSPVVGVWTEEPGPPAERGSNVAICLFGFDEGTQVDVTVTRPDGTEEHYRRVPGYDFDSVFRFIGRDAPLGTWEVRAAQGGRVAETTFAVTDATRPRVIVAPASTLDYFFVYYPQVAPGEAQHVVFTGFEGGERIETRLYSGYLQELPFDRPIEVGMEADGSALLTIPTEPGDYGRWYCLALEPSAERRMYPDLPPDRYGARFCFWQPFTTQGATDAILGIYCDALRCGWTDEIWDPPQEWHVTGVAPDDPDGGLNVRTAPQAVAGNVTAVLRWDAAGLIVAERRGGWSAIHLDGWAADAYLAPDPAATCPLGQTALRVTRVAPDDPDGGLIVRAAPRAAAGNESAVLRWDAAGVCGAEGPNPEGWRAVIVSGWVDSRFIAEVGG